MNRYLTLLPVAIICFVSGCSMMIARCGADVSTLTTRAQVHETFGNPVTTGTFNGQSFDDFHTRRKISEEMRSSGLDMALGMTLGLFEFIYFPQELYLLGRRTINGYDIRFTYDEAGNVTNIYLEGDPLCRFPTIEHGRSELQTTTHESILDEP